MANQRHVERDTLSCSICLELLKEPKTLTCMHRYCESCLNLYIVTSTARTSDSRRGFSCPECREFIPAPDSSSINSAWASKFKTDFKIKTLVEIYELKQESKVAEVNNACPKHEDKEQELYCYDCSAPVCHLCAVISHRGCNKIATVKEAILELEATWQAYDQQLPHFKNEALQIENYRDSYKTQIHQKKDCAEKEIREHAERMRQIVTCEEEKLLTQVQTNYNKLERYVAVFTKYLDNLKSLENVFSSQLKTLSDFEFVLKKYSFDSIDLWMTENEGQTKRCSRLCTLLSKVELRFLPQKLSCTNLGSIQVKCYE